MLYNMFPCMFELKVGIKSKEQSTELDLHAKETPGLRLYFVEGPSGESACKALLTLREDGKPEEFAWGKRRTAEELLRNDSSDFEFLVEPVLEALRLGDLDYMGEILGVGKKTKSDLSESQLTGDFFMAVQGRVAVESFSKNTDWQRSSQLAVEDSFVTGAVVDADRTGKKSFLWRPDWCQAFWVSAENVLKRQTCFSESFVEDLRKIQKPDSLLFRGFVKILHLEGILGLKAWGGIPDNYMLY